MGFWDLMIKKDDFIISSAEAFRRLEICFSPSKRRVKKQMNATPPQGENDDLYIILNAPSIATQDLSVLKGKTTMFVNRGFMHPLYKELQPKYHVFLDTKMIKGIWPVSWLGDIISMSPNITIVLPIFWSDNPMFQPYKDHIYWLDFNLPFHSLGVSGACFSFAIKNKFSHIYFSGFDATGIAHEMVQSTGSHFYGNDKELIGKSTNQFALDLYMHSRHLHDLNRFAEYCKERNIHVINITNGGLLDMFPREQVLPIKLEKE